VRDTTRFDTAGDAASRVKRLLTELGLPGKIIRRAAVAAYEAEMNVFIHAHQGLLTVTVSPQVITMVVSDHGPGIEDLDLAMRKGYSTASDAIREMGFGAGMGLPNIKVSADKFRIESSPRGTVLTITIFIK
jgi:anti-sigma regulatory factor (Ser/Thr protein kinase)